MTSVTAYLSLAVVGISGCVYAYNLFLCNPSSMLPWKLMGKSNLQDREKTLSLSEGVGGSPMGKQKVL